MSALNNQTEETEDSTAKALRVVMTSPKKQISEPLLREAGVDVDMLVSTYNEAVKPYLDYLEYRELLESDPRTGERLRSSRWDEEKKIMIAPEPWDHMLRRFGILQVADQQVITVLQNPNWYCHEGDSELPRNIRLKVFLTRKGQWILWYGVMKGQSVVSEQLFFFEHIREFWLKLHELVPDSYRLAYESGGAHDEPQYMPLFVEKNLRRILKYTIDIREGRINKMKHTLNDADARIATVEFPRRS